MKRTITGVAALALITAASVPNAEAWTVSPSFSKSSSTTQRSGRDSQSFGKNSAGRDRWEIKDSNMIGGNVNNSILAGRGGFRLTNQNISQSSGAITVGSVGGVGQKGSSGRATSGMGDGNSFGHNSGGNQQNFHLGDANVDARDMRSGYTQDDHRVDNRR